MTAKNLDDPLKALLRERDLATCSQLEVLEGKQ